MRQMATLILMAQCGSFIPAEELKLELLIVFLSRWGWMTMGKVKVPMMEMNEVSYIVHNATRTAYCAR